MTNKEKYQLAKQRAELVGKIIQLSGSNSDLRYQELIHKRQNDELTTDEHQELLALSDHYEARDVERIKLLTKLAEYRGISLAELRDELEIFLR